MGKCDCPKSKPKKNGCKKKPTCEPPPPPPPPPPPNPFEPLIRSVDGVATLMSQMKEYICNLNPDDEMEMLAGDGTSGVNIILINLLYGVTLLNELCSDEDQRVLDLPKEQMFCKLMYVFFKSVFETFKKPEPEPPPEESSEEEC